jgi:hypothetical protein
MLTHEHGDQVVEVATVRSLDLFVCCLWLALATYQKCFLACCSMSLCFSSSYLGRPLLPPLWPRDRKFACLRALHGPNQLLPWPLQPSSNNTHRGPACCRVTSFRHWSGCTVDKEVAIQSSELP